MSTPAENAAREALITTLAMLLHEAGREAVAKGLVHMKGEGITPKPFCEWPELSEDAKEGRRVQARWLVTNQKVVLGLLTALGDF